jgi:hypothetical protein
LISKFGAMWSKEYENRGKQGKKQKKEEKGK